MNEDKFWEIIDYSKEALADLESAEKMKSKLIDLPPGELVDFYDIMEKYRAIAYKKQLYGAGSLLNGSNLTDDSFLYFTCWLISRGEKVYKAALTNADTLANLSVELSDDGVDVYYQSYCGVVSDIFESKTGYEIYDSTKKENMKEIEWSEYSIDELKHKFPKLWTKYGYLRAEPSRMETMITNFVVKIISVFIDLKNNDST